MLDTPQRRRFLSPAMLLVVLLCFFLPFFSVSCSAGLGQMKGTVTGMDQVVGGEPDYTGFRPPASYNAAATGEQISGISPAALVAFVVIVAGIGLGIGLPRPRARWIAGAAASGIALVAVVANQLMVRERVQEGLDRAEWSFQNQFGDTSLFGQSIPTPVFEFADEPGFWIVTVLLGLVVAYNVWEVAAQQRGPSRQRLTSPQRPPTG